MNTQAPIDTAQAEPVAEIGDNGQDKAILDLIADHGIDTILNVYVKHKGAEVLAPLVKRADELSASAGRADIKDAESAKGAATLLKMFNTAGKSVEDAKTPFKAPILAATRTIDGAFKAVVTKIDAGKKVIGDKAVAYQRKLDDAAAAERKRLADEAEAQRKAAEEAAKEGNVVEAEIISQQAEETAKQAEKTVAGPTRSESGATMFARHYPRFEITDEAKLAPGFWMPNHQAIEAAVAALSEDELKAGDKIPGLRTWQETKMSAR